MEMHSLKSCDPLLNLLKSLDYSLYPVRVITYKDKLANILHSVFFFFAYLGGFVWGIQVDFSGLGDDHLSWIIELNIFWKQIEFKVILAQLGFHPVI